VNYDERRLGDYAKDTAHLAMLEHGACTLQTDRYYSTEWGIPDGQRARFDTRFISTKTVDNFVDRHGESAITLGNINGIIF
jgi:uncharacterized protein YdaU (DUF1376 family)